MEETVSGALFVMFRAPVKLAGIVTAARVPLGMVPVLQFVATCHTALPLGRKTADSLTVSDVVGPSESEPEDAFRL